MDLNILRAAYLPGISSKSQGGATAQNQNDATARNQNVPGNGNPLWGDGVSLSPSLRNLLNSPINLSGDWTDRFNVASQLLGASSFVELGAAKFKSRENTALQNAVHLNMVYNSHASGHAFHATGRNLEYLDEIAKAFSGMINALKSLKDAGEDEISALAFEFEEDAERAAWYAEAAVEEFGAALNSLGLDAEASSAGQAVRDSSKFANTILNKDYSHDEFKAMEERLKTAFKGDAEAIRSEADDVLNQFFSDEVFSGGKLDPNALGMTGGNFAELANDPEKLQKTLTTLESTLGEVKKTIVSQGEHYKELKRANEYYERSLNEFDEGRYGVQALEDLRLAVEQYSLREKVNFVGDFWAEQIEKNRDRNILEWLEKVKNGLDDGEEYESLEKDKGNERIFDNIRALEERTRQPESDAGEDANPDQEREALTDEAKRQREAFIEDVEAREALIDEVLNLILNSGIAYKTGAFGESDGVLVENFNDLISYRPAAGQTGQ